MRETEFDDFNAKLFHRYTNYWTIRHFALYKTTHFRQINVPVAVVAMSNLAVKKFLNLRLLLPTLALHHEVLLLLAAALLLLFVKPTVLSVWSERYDLWRFKLFITIQSSQIQFSANAWSCHASIWSLATNALSVSIIHAQSVEAISSIALNLFSCREKQDEFGRRIHTL
jgi:hypothetical protein